MLIDTHAHLYLKEFNEDLVECINRFKNHGVQQVLMPNVDVESIERMHLLEDENPDFFKSMMGVHPCYVKDDYLQQLSACKTWFKKRNYCAVGEIGIDLYWDKTTLGIQQDAFRQQIQWARELGKPIAIHARESFQEIFQIIDEENTESLTGVFHCFTGGLDEARKIMSYGGFKMGVGGVLTYKKSGLDKTIAQVPLNELVLETDSPYLAPTPKRGKRNEPSYLMYIAEKLSQVKGETVQTVAEATTENAKKLFNL
ncbi:MAG: hydrolase TatD [Flavobacteriales bacterium]|nr:hydrolase TatD [Flavobacteriales bacterium]|tara:strand:+ start:17368 stop:18135 length:768 start_codon:yes stop_codon:yes gene_type:complete